MEKAQCPVVTVRASTSGVVMYRLRTIAGRRALRQWEISENMISLGVVLVEQAAGNGMLRGPGKPGAPKQRR